MDLAALRHFWAVVKTLTLECQGREDKCVFLISPEERKKNVIKHSESSPLLCPSLTLSVCLHE